MMTCIVIDKISGSLPHKSASLIVNTTYLGPKMLTGYFPQKDLFPGLKYLSLRR
jgi:hypothetical protein